MATFLVIFFVALILVHVEVTGSCVDNEIRLVDGRAPNEGRVEYCYDGDWGTICHHFWDHKAAAVVCRELGLPTEVPTALLNYRGGCGVILLDYVLCDGSEDNLSSCSHDHFYNVGHCSHSTDAGVRCLSEPECSEGEVRLHGDRGPNEGRVEICHQGAWSVVCGSDWDYNDALVVCRELNLSTAVVEAIEGYDAKGADVYVIDEVQCTGSEDRLFDCLHSLLETNNCEQSYIAGVKCLNEPECNDGDIRLMGGYISTVGRVEVCQYGTWGTICRSDNFEWNYYDAMVVCRQLGYYNQWARALPEVGLGSGRIVYSQVDCTGHEESLSECNKTEDISSWCLSHEHDVGVICLDDLECLDGEIRLLGGPSDNEGRVEFCGSYIWRTICSVGWDLNDVFVSCRQLGYQTGYPITLPIEEGSITSIYSGYVQCYGSESSLFDCDNIWVDDYACRTDGHEYAGVKCFHEPECVDGAIQLIENRELEIGYSFVQFCIHGVWVFIGGNSWDDTEAKIVCGKVGFLTLNATAGIYKNYSTNPPILVDDFSCSGSENDLIDCEYTEVGFNSTCRDYLGEATVSCIPRECNDTDVRLSNGTSEYDGAVEVCVEGVWVTVCDEESWDIYDAMVICKQLGYYNGPSYPLKLTAERNIRLAGSLSAQSHHIDSVKCSGTESHFDQCSYSFIKAESCTLNYQAGVICTAAVCSEGSVRVVGTFNPKEGRVELCYQSYWHSICSDNWNVSHATVVCSTLGYSINQESILFDYFGAGVNPILPEVIQCNGNETHLTECTTTKIDQPELCNKLAGVICEAPCLSNGVVDCDDCVSSVVCPPTSSSLSCQCTSDCFSQGSCCSDMTAIPNCFETSVAECTNGAVRLTGGVANSSSGRVEVCVNGVWGSVCDKLGDWIMSPYNAVTVCRQLNLPTDRAHVVSLFGGGSGPVFLDNVQCIGTEKDLLSCLHSGIGNHRCGGSDSHVYDVGVICTDDCVNEVVRLRDGTSEYNGRVEVCVDGVWASICSDQWTDIEASVVCLELGFSSQDAMATNVFGLGDGGPILMGEVHCSGNESQLTKCQYLDQYHFNCTIVKSAGVICDARGNFSRCISEWGQPPDSQNKIENIERFGVCEPYNGNIEMCNDLLTPYVDYVFIPLAHETQNRIGSILESNLPNLTIVKTEDYCHDQIYRIICNYYFIPCGNLTNTLPPSSICPEECSLVEESCPSVWEVVRLAMDSELPFIDCTDTGSPLLPLPNCCTGAGITQQQSETENKERKQEVGISGDVIAVISVGCVVLVLAITALVVIYKLCKRKQVNQRAQRMQSRVILLNRGGTVIIEDTVLAGKAEAISNHYSEVGGIKSKPNCPKSPYLRALSRQMIIKHGQLTLLQHIGQGEFGIVYKATLKEHFGNTSVVAVKTLKGYFDQSEIDKIMEESIKMKKFQHIHVMGLVGVCLDAGPAPYIIMPYMANGSLQSYLKKERKTFVLEEDTDEDTIEDVRKRLTVISSQIADGMSYLASEKFIHRDLAARNCMIDVNFVIKITDFGLSEDIFGQNYFRQSSSGETVKLPVKWMAPESLSDGHFSEMSDVWSYGVTLWEIFSGGKSPYPGMDPVSLVSLLNRGERMSKPDNAACSQVIFDLMLQCWEYEPMNRPKFSEIHAKTVNYVEQMAGYLEMNINSTNIIPEVSNEGVIIISNVDANMDDNIQPEMDNYTPSCTSIGADIGLTIEPAATNTDSLLSAPGPLYGDEGLSIFSDSDSDTSNF